MSVVINRVKAVDFIRGIAVVAAVVCHQQYLLHTSEWIQFISIYSVTSLVCMMGYTKGLSIEKFVHSKSKDSFLL